MTAPTMPHTTALTFDGLVAAIGQAHAVLAQQATKAVNISLTLRNWAIGFYIAEFELQGENRAGYGDRLIPALADALRARDVSNTERRQLYAYLAFYRTYPQIVQTASAQSTRLFPLALPGEKVPPARALSEVSPEIDSNRLISDLSDTHFKLLVELQAPLKRRFYEVETLRGNWSVRELKRQIDTQYFERSTLSTNKDLASQQVHAAAEQQTPQLNTYVSYYKAKQMQPTDQPPIGILLCTRKNHQLVEYALADMANNIFVSRYQTELPGKDEIAAFLQRAMQELDSNTPGEPST